SSAATMMRTRWWRTARRRQAGKSRESAGVVAGEERVSSFMCWSAKRPNTFVKTSGAAAAARGHKKKGRRGAPAPPRGRQAKVAYGSGHGHRRAAKKCKEICARGQAQMATARGGASCQGIEGNGISPGPVRAAAAGVTLQYPAGPERTGRASQAPELRLR